MLVKKFKLSNHVPRPLEVNQTGKGNWGTGIRLPPFAWSSQLGT